MSGRRQQGGSRSARYPAPTKVPRVSERTAMRVLLDTHAFLWWIGDDPRLSATARRIIGASDSELFLSAASAWELAIKAGLGRLGVPGKLEAFVAEQLQANRIAPLPVSIDHALFVAHLPKHHRDPFDRLLVAQAILEGLPIITGDRQLARYRVDVVW